MESKLSYIMKKNIKPTNLVVNVAFNDKKSNEFFYILLYLFNLNDLFINYFSEIIFLITVFFVSDLSRI